MSGEISGVPIAEGGQVLPENPEEIEWKAALERIRVFIAVLDQAVEEPRSKGFEAHSNEAGRTEAVAQDINGLFADFDERVAAVHRRLDAILQAPAAR